MGSFSGKHILITGGASGIGFLLARGTLQRKAAKVILWDINGENIEEAREKLHTFGNRLLTYRVDISQKDQIYKTARQVRQDVGSLDMVFNNAGIIAGGPFREISPLSIHKTLAVNLEGAMHSTRAFLDGMNDKKSGHIINMASASGLIANPKMSVYAGSKAGMIGWSESLRIELEQAGTGIRVTTVEPSYIDTGMFEGVTTPRLTPLLDPEPFAEQVLDAVEKNHIHLRAPFMVKLIPLLKGILPTPIFDFIAGKLFGVYNSMDTFTGRS